MVELSRAEKNVFGEQAYYHPITHRIVETGVGSIHPDRQAYLHCEAIEQEDGKEHADKLRHELLEHCEKEGHKNMAEHLRERLKAEKPITFERADPSMPPVIDKPELVKPEPATDSEKPFAFSSNPEPME
jgi:hypothetical protein